MRKYVYPSSGEVIEKLKHEKIITTLPGEFHNNVPSEKMVEINFAGAKQVKAGRSVWHWGFCDKRTSINIQKNAIFCINRTPFINRNR
jgi:hypothetical protein